MLFLFCLCLCIADERDTVQRKTFTKWVNKHLIRVSLCCHGNLLCGMFLHYLSRICNCDNNYYVLSSCKNVHMLHILLIHQVLCIVF